MESEDRDPTGKRVREARNEEDVRGPREYETPRHPPPVDGRLESREDLGNALNLVQNGLRREARHEARWIRSRCTSNGVVVERRVGVASFLADHASQRRRAALTRSVDEYRRCVTQRLAQARRQVAGERRASGHGQGPCGSIQVRRSAERSFSRRLKGVRLRRVGRRNGHRRGWRAGGLARLRVRAPPPFTAPGQAAMASAERSFDGRLEVSSPSLGGLQGTGGERVIEGRSATTRGGTRFG